MLNVQRNDLNAILNLMTSLSDEFNFFK